jgi:hypothetical protein
MRNCDLRHRCGAYEQDSMKCTFFYNFCREHKEFYAEDEQARTQDQANRLLRLAGRENEIDKPMD